MGRTIRSIQKRNPESVAEQEVVSQASNLVSQFLISPPFLPTFAMSWVGARIGGDIARSSWLTSLVGTGPGGEKEPFTRLIQRASSPAASFSTLSERVDAFSAVLSRLQSLTPGEEIEEMRVMRERFNLVFTFRLVFNLFPSSSIFLKEREVSVTVFPLP